MYSERIIIVYTYIPYILIQYKLLCFMFYTLYVIEKPKFQRERDADDIFILLLFIR